MDTFRYLKLGVSSKSKYFKNGIPSNWINLSNKISFDKFVFSNTCLNSIKVNGWISNSTYLPASKVAKSPEIRVEFEPVK